LVIRDPFFYGIRAIVFSSDSIFGYGILDGRRIGFRCWGMVADLSAQCVAMSTYLGQTRIQASSLTIWLYIKLLKLKLKHAYINISPPRESNPDLERSCTWNRGVLHLHKHHPKILNLQISNPTPTQLEKWTTLVIGFVTFTYTHAVHTKTKHGFMEKTYKYFKKNIYLHNI